MGNEDVDIRMSAENAQALAAIERMADAMESMGERGKKSEDSLGSAIKGMTGNFMSATGSIDVAKEALDFFRESNRQMQREVADASRTVDESYRRLAVQAGRLSPVDKQAVWAASEKYAIPFNQASEAATQLISTGFSADQVAGGALDTALATAVSTNATDVGQTAQALSMFLSATGQAQTTDNLKKVGLQFQNLFQGTNVQAADIQSLAGSTAAITQMGVSPKDVMPTYALARRLLGGAEAATGFKAVTTPLATAAGNDTAVSALAALGIQPEEVNLSNGDIEATLRRLKQGVDSVDPTTANIALDDLFGKRGTPAAMAMLQKLDKLSAYKALNNPAAYDDAVKIATTGDAAEDRLAAIRLQKARAGRGDISDAARAADEMEASLIEQSASGVATKAAGLAHAAATSVNLPTGVAGSIGRVVAAGAQSGYDVEAMSKTGGMAGLMAAIGQLVAELRGPKELIIKGGGESIPATTRAAQAGQ